MRRALGYVLASALTLIALVLLWQVRVAFVLFALSLGVAGALRPAIKSLAGRRVPRPLAVALVCAGAIGNNAAGFKSRRVVPIRWNRITMFHQAGRYFPPSRRTSLRFVSAVSALDTDISPDLSPFNPIRSRSSPRERPFPSRIKFNSSSRLLPRRARC